MTTVLDITPASDTELAIARLIDAPRAAVWRCWTEANLLQQPELAVRRMKTLLHLHGVDA